MKNYVRSWIIAVLCLLGSCTTMQGMKYLEHVDPLFVLSMALAEGNEQPEMRTSKIRAQEVLAAFKALAGKQRKAIGALEHWSYTYSFIIAGPIEDFEYIRLARDSDGFKNLQKIFMRTGSWEAWEVLINEKFECADGEIRSQLVDALKQLFEEKVGDFATNEATRSKIKKQIADENVTEEDVFSDGFAFICVIDEFVAAASKFLAPSYCIIL